MMKPSHAQAEAVRGANPGRRARAFTLVEMMVALGVFSFVVVGLVYTQMFCLKYDELANSKMGASESSRRSFDLLMTDVRSAKVWRIGTGSTNSFTAVTNGTLQIGNAIQLSPTTDTNFFVRYFFDTNKYMLYRGNYANNTLLKCQTLAANLTNTTGESMSFHAEDYRGSNMFDFQYKYVVVATMEFAQYQYPLTKVGPNYYYNYYRMQLKLASHNFN
jgi:prepilin-type N-terminal cleavage/methylation domain-containing protein